MIDSYCKVTEVLSYAHLKMYVCMIVYIRGVASFCTMHYALTAVFWSKTTTAFISNETASNTRSQFSPCRSKFDQ